MIPEELEKQVWQARKEVRGEKARGRVNVCVRARALMRENSKERMQTAKTISVCGRQKRACWS